MGAVTMMKEIETEIAEILALLPTEAQIIVALRYQGGFDSLKNPIADARQRLQSLQAKLSKEQSDK